MAEPIDLEPIKARLAAADSGPWLTPAEAGDPYAVSVPVDHEGCDVWPWKGELAEENMVLAYAAPTDVAALIAEVERLRRHIVRFDLAYGFRPPDAPDEVYDRVTLRHIPPAGDKH